MVALRTVLIVALDTRSLLSPAAAAYQFKSLLVHLSVNANFLLLVSEPYIGCPIYAYHVSPLSSSNFFNYAIDIRTEETLEVRASHLRVLLQLDTPIAEPTTSWEFLGKRTSIARLMDSS